MPAFESIQRPERWNVPFSTEMTDIVLNRLLAIQPFNKLDPSRFKGKVTIRGILQNDARIVRFKRGEIIVRQGDWGNSAFFVAAGSVRADLESAHELPGDVLGRRKPQRKSFFQVLAQLWSNSSEPEVRDVASYRDDPRIGTRGKGKDTRIYLQDMSAMLDKNRTALIDRGQFFGELAALGRMPRQATVVAERDATLLEIRWQGLRDLMRGDEGLRKHIDQLFRERALKWFLLNTHLFADVSESELETVVGQAEFETYGQFDWAGSFKKLAKQGVETNLQHEPLIAEEGDHPNGIMIVRNGLVRVSKRQQLGHRTVGYLTPGQIYGRGEIFDGWLSKTPKPLNYSLRAIGIASVIVIPTALVEKLFLEKQSQHRLATNDSRNDPLGNRPELEMERLNTDFVEFATQHRFVNGTATMLIDMDRCTRCDDCVRACASTHDNNPRFLRQGPIQNNMMVAGACMHCEDPVCMIECPTGAIHRNIEEGQVMINDYTCIGCSACANNCPYQAIRMVEVRHENGDFIRDDQKHAPIVKATKCDLCSDQWGGPACQRACPHDALVRMDMRDVKGLADWTNR